MIKLKPSDETRALHTATMTVLDQMNATEPGTEEYHVLLSRLERLNTLRTTKRPGRVSPDTIVTVTGNFLMVLTIVAYEQHHVMSSKALGFIPKMK